jgi:hypothetical protein
MRKNRGVKCYLLFALLIVCSLLKAQQYDSIRIFQSERTCLIKEFGEKSISPAILEILRNSNKLLFSKTMNAKTAILIRVDSIETYSPVLCKKIDYNKLRASILKGKKVKLIEIHYKSNNIHKVFYLIREL